MRFVGAVILIACLLMVGCAPASTQSGVSQEPSSTVAQDSEPFRSESATGTLKGWFAQDKSARIAAPAADQPTDAVGYFGVTPTGDDPASGQGVIVMRVYVTADTKTDLRADPLDPAACAGTWLWIDYRMVGQNLVADRVYAPAGVAY